ncbi:shikimate kinase [Acetivibrio cellulolyticus]|uniref:shikimate kinase n=1 Tax=Acetivibrio cellulolyticus TaxID=35830 RepID=UPI0001E2F5D1|nr:shikimate kinase [Acetivibrio cellulolyticus]
MNKSNVVLIGMPGAGKSTIGVLLAKALKKPFIDTDLLIQQKYGMFLQDIIDREGIKKFLEMEESVVAGIDVKDHVIATGGSVIYSNLSLNQLKKEGTLFYLKLRFDEIDNRLKDITSRGIAKENNKTLVELYNERVHLYEKHADIMINCSNKHIEDIVSEIKNKFMQGMLHNSQ